MRQKKNIMNRNKRQTRGGMANGNNIEQIEQLPDDGLLGKE
jgi:hypothetical protein